MGCRRLGLGRERYLAFELVAALCIAGCSSQWHASMELRQAPSAPQPLQVKLTSALGDEQDSSLADRCVQVNIHQSPKLPNRITITVADRNGKMLGQAQTNDLANRPFTIVLEGGGQILITPGRRCERN
jgi:hypothetical protein